MGDLIRLEFGLKPRNMARTWPKPDIDIKSYELAQRIPKFNFDTKGRVKFDIVLGYTFTYAFSIQIGP